MPKSSEDSGNREKELEQLEAKPQLSEAEHLLAENRVRGLSTLNQLHNSAIILFSLSHSLV